MAPLLENTTTLTTINTEDFLHVHPRNRYPQRRPQWVRKGCSGCHYFWEGQTACSPEGFRIGKRKHLYKDRRILPWIWSCGKENGHKNASSAAWVTNLIDLQIRGLRPRTLSPGPVQASLCSRTGCRSEPPGLRGASGFVQDPSGEQSCVQQYGPSPGSDKGLIIGFALCHLGWLDSLS